MFNVTGCQLYIRLSVLKPLIFNHQPSNLQTINHQTFKPSTIKPSILNHQPSNLQTINHQTFNLQPSTFNLQPSTFNLQTINHQTLAKRPRASQQSGTSSIAFNLTWLREWAITPLLQWRRLNLSKNHELELSIKLFKTG
ncbi:hypothetical protein [Moorena sp. SIO3I6]|uniref:hypothetical protein n=1 Tax=Moorena sp. SIO3I6 TaxID=2607831 RepID=UPI0013F878C4|nr:hypothetical protein [Moorena sp. SIO3I6]NEP22799.1 hypothetical protein [Moorena sp. SIO3I6]